MKVIVVKNYEEMSKKAASIVANQIAIKPNSTIGLATGDTPKGMYKELIKMYHNGEIDFSQIKTFNLDEYFGLQKNSIQSYYSYMMKNFFNYININDKNINIPDGMTKNVDKECLKYEQKIKDVGGIDIQILGIGVNGHIGFNEPGTNFDERTHLVNLDKKTIESNSRFFKSIEDVPSKAISMGIRTIMQAKKIILLANGSIKADAINKAINGEISQEVPASVLQLHSDVTVIIDNEVVK